MWRISKPLALLAIALLQLISNRVAQPLAISEQTTGYTQYLPLITIPSVVEAVETARGETTGYPTDYFLYGYVRNLTHQPLYSAVVDIQVTIWPYTGPGEIQTPSQPYTEIVQVTPAFTATLPSQINPFFYELTLGKASATIGGIVGVSASPWTGQARYSPLTINGYRYLGTNLSGTARNDTSQFLHDIRVIVFNPENCRWVEADVNTSDLPPGEETEFSRGYNTTACLSNDLIIVGQGKIQP